MKYFFFLFSLSFFFLACEDEKYEYSPDTEIELAKDPCFGTCPVYTFYINGNGEARFTGKQNVEKVGNWEKTFSIKETNALFDAFSESDFWAFEDEYTDQVTDLPTTWVTFRKEGKEKKIKDYFGAPPELKELEKLAEIMAEGNEGWTEKEGG